ncbi:MULTISPECIES: DUF397 domain-containing protein [Streptomyces]|uniref:DUF397 domain-containing protein n=1 Tax=Streptomyces luteosporeus TaxID=173856 RepID=A0ABP6G1V1_9ACTN
MNTKSRIADCEDLDWFKSSYSDEGGEACVEVAFDWRKSSYSGNGGEACVEVAATSPHTIHVRDSKLGAQAPRVDVPAASWAAFLGFLVGA